MNAILDMQQQEAWFAALALDANLSFSDPRAPDSTKPKNVQSWRGGFYEAHWRRLC